MISENILTYENGHFFVELDGARWLVDTGAPTSFGEVRSLVFAGKSFRIRRDYLGLDAQTISGYLGIRCAGLLGMDMLGGFDHVFDVSRGVLSSSTARMESSGVPVALSFFMRISIVRVEISTTVFAMFLDTGAQISYLQSDLLEQFPPAGVMEDFYPGFGRFETTTHHVDVVLGGIRCNVRCGILPTPLALTLRAAGVQGIVGNQIFSQRVIGFFPRRKTLRLEEPVS